MVVEDNDIVEVGGAQGFTRITEPKKERTDPPSISPHTYTGWGVGGEHPEAGLQEEAVKGV